MRIFNFNTSLEVEPEWILTLKETQGKLFVFLEKLEVRMYELTESAIPELLELKVTDELAFGNFLFGVQGQLNAIRQKANDTYDEKVEQLHEEISFQVNLTDPYYNQLKNFRINCSERLQNVFERIYEDCYQQLYDTTIKDYEVLYQQILDEYASIKNKFTCHQCGAGIPLDKIYFVVSHLACPVCQTKNTFQPSTLAMQLEHIGRGLAEQRTKPLLDKYYEAQRLERELYLQKHKLEMKYHDNLSQKDKKEFSDTITALQKKHVEVKENILPLYKKYERAMFDEWKRLVPDLAEQTEKFYQSLQKRKV